MDEITAKVAVERGRVLREIRTHFRLSAKKLAERLARETEGEPLSKDAIYKYERGENLLRQPTAERIARLFEIDVSELLAGEEMLSPATGDRSPSQERDWLFGRSLFQKGFMTATATEVLSGAKAVRGLLDSACRREIVFTAVVGHRIHHFSELIAAIITHLSILIESPSFRRIQRLAEDYGEFGELAPVMEGALDSALAVQGEAYRLEAPDTQQGAASRQDLAARWLRDLQALNDSLLHAIRACERESGLSTEAETDPMLKLHTG